MNIKLNRKVCGYSLTPVNQRIRKKLREINDGNESVLFQTDWDFPVLARTLGWNGKVGRELCEHASTNGKVTCAECGLTPSDFITAASSWLDKHCGQVFRNRGSEYFDI